MQPTTILVNEKMEIIDGQGRLGAFRKLNLPVIYEIKEGIGIDECISMNIKMENWNIYDYIDSYAAQGVEDYVQLTSLDDEESTMTLMEVAMCMSDDSWSRNVDRPLREGKYKFDDNDTNRGCLNFIKSTVPYLDKIQGGGGHGQYVPVLIGLYKLDLIDDTHMQNSIECYHSTMHSAATIDAALGEIQNVYNYNSRKKKRFRDAYLDAMEEKGARYKN